MQKIVIYEVLLCFIPSSACLLALCSTDKNISVSVKLVFEISLKSYRTGCYGKHKKGFNIRGCRSIVGFVGMILSFLFNSFYLFVLHSLLVFLFCGKGKRIKNRRKETKTPLNSNVFFLEINNYFLMWNVFLNQEK